jgi:lysine-N-methylase
MKEALAMTLRPAYSESFRCIGSSCEDTCCQGWSVPIDEATHQRYHDLPASPLRTLIVDNLVRIEKKPNEAEPSAAKPAGFAKIRMDAANQCPLLSEDRLCRIQQAYGERLLSHSCATYPRIVSTVERVEERALTLSCPEAARLVLLTPALLLKDAEPRRDADEATHPVNGRLILSWFLPIRAAAITLVRNRAYPLWQRLFLLGIFCRRIDSINAAEAKAQNRIALDLPVFLHEFDSTVATGSLRRPMEALPVDRPAQLDAVLRLAGMLLHRSNVRPRFVECINAFTAGIGNGPGGTLESLTAHYAVAHDRWFEPFFARYPHILENYLINTIFRCQFPFGREGLKGDATPALSREFARLTAQFALIKGLLIGVAGFHREAFSAEHVVHTVQAASKHFEHHPEFLSMAHALLAESRLDGARGTAILLRNSDPVGRRPGAEPLRIPPQPVYATAAPRPQSVGVEMVTVQRS